MNNEIATNVLATAGGSVASFSPIIIENIKTWVTYVGVLAAALVAAWAGIRKALKDLDKTDGNKVVIAPTPQAFVGGTIMETTTLLMWSESNRDVTEALQGLSVCFASNIKAIEGLPDEIGIRLDHVVNAINYNTSASRDVCRDLAELRHQIERLRDKMP